MNPEFIKSRAALARALNVSAATVARYLKREDFPVGTEPPWDVEDVAEIKAWQEEELREDRNHRNQLAKSDFWRMNGPRTTLKAATKYEGVAVADALEQPIQICTKAERNILLGKAVLSAAAAKEYVSLTVQLKALWLHEARTIPRWLRGCPTDEVEARLAAVAAGRILWHGEAVADGVTK